MRGSPILLLVLEGDVGIIPGCGAHFPARSSKRRWQGSSPRVRGSLRADRLRHWRARIIPAGAGLTAPPCPTSLHGWDHPRGCGAHSSFSSDGLRILGSSPRVRGSQQDVRNKAYRLGIIPRGCGAHEPYITNVGPFWGSSPRVRGSPTVYKKTRAAWGIIPAGAGLTRASSDPQRLHGDHPRGCGAHYLMRSAVWSDSGSSPRVRGSQTSRYTIFVGTRIIPAGAGLT